MSREQRTENKEQVAGSREQVAGSSWLRASRFICLMLLGVLLGANLFGQEAEQQAETQQAVRITLDEAVEMAFKNNLSLESSRISMTTKKRASDLRWNYFLPSVTVAGAYQRDNEASKVSGFFPVDMNSINPIIPPETLYGVVPYSADGPQWRFSIPIQASITLSLAMMDGLSLLRQDYETGLISYDKAKVQLERDVRKAYHNMLLLQENIELLRSNYENVERQVQMAQANYNAGLAPELVLLQARVARENMRPVMDQAENGLKLSMAQFAMFLGLDYNTPFELIPVQENIDFVSVDTAEMISKASANKPEIQELRRNIQMLESKRRVDMYSLFPALTFSWNTSPTYIGDPMKDWLNPAPGSLTISLGLRLHSLIPFSIDFQAVKATEDQIRTANIGLAQLVTGTEIEVYNIILSLERTHTNMEALAQNVNLAQRSYNLTEQAYRAGLQDYFQVQNAQVSLHQARVQMLEQQFNYLNGLIDLEYAIGVPFGTLSKRSE